MTTRRRRGFTLIEVLASLAIAVLLTIPIARLVAGTAGAFAGLERSTERRVGMQAAMAAATRLQPLRKGQTAIGDFIVTTEPYQFERSVALAKAGWQLYAITVRSAGGSGDIVFQTVRLGKLQ